MMRSHSAAVLSYLGGLGPVTTARARPLTNHYAAILARMAAAKASGRPGPGVITGAYRAGISARGSRAGSDDPQAYRLEVGYSGVDALGRRYHQPPYPHFGPAADAVEGLYAEALGDMADRL